mgnify:CR=1 FL=1
MKEIVNYLIQAQSPDNFKRQEASNYLENLEVTQPASFIYSMALVLSLEENPLQARLLAALNIKNTLSFPHLASAYASCPEKQQIRELCLGSLASSAKEVRNIGAQAVSALAQVDLPKGEWSSLIPVLIKNAQGLNLTYKSTALLCLGYICEGIQLEALSDCKNEILTAIVSCFEEDDPSIRVIAIQALTNSLNFYSENFNNNLERDFLFRVLCNNAEHPDSEVKVHALRALCEIATLYPYSLVYNLNQVGAVTYEAIGSSYKTTCILAIDFWNIIADLEASKAENQEPLLGCIETAAESLTRILVPHLYEVEIEDEWTPGKGAFTTLCSVCSVQPEKVSSTMLCFIKQSLFSEAQNQLKGGLYAVASASKGVCVKEFVDRVLEIVERGFSKEGAWCLGKVCEWQPQAFEGKEQRLMHCLLRYLNSTQDLVDYVCSSLVLALEDLAFEEILLEKLMLEVLDKLKTKPNTQTKLSLFSVLTTLLEKIPDSSLKIVDSFLPSIVDLFQESIRNICDNSYVFTSTAVQLACARLPVSRVSHLHASQIVECAVFLFNTKSSLVEETLQALGALAINLQESFIEYFQQIAPYLVYSITNEQPQSVIKAGIICLGDLYRTIGPYIVEYISQFLKNVLLLLDDPNKEIELKIQVINCLGDIAGSIKADYLSFTNKVLPYIDKAAGVALQQSGDPDVQLVLEELRESVLQFYVGLIHGLREDNMQSILEERYPKILAYVQIVLSPEYTPGHNITTVAIGLIGDIFSVFPMKKFFLEVEKYINQAMGSQNHEVSAIARWAGSIIKYNRVC